MSRGLAMSVAVAVAIAASSAGGDDRPSDSPVEFVRVVVPAERFREVPLEAGRLVPMPLAEFDRAVAALLPSAAARGPQPLAATARYDLAIDPVGRLAGSLEFDVDAAATLVTAMPLGPIHAERATLRAADRAGEAVLFGDATGGVSVRTPTAGTYACDVAVKPRGAAEYGVPLVPALATRLVVRLPPGTRPVVARTASGGVLVAPPKNGADGWTIDTAGLDVLEFTVVAADASQPRVRCWNRVGVRGHQVDVAIRVVPEGPWRPGEVSLRKDPSLELVRATFSDGSTVRLEPGRDETRFVIDLPAAVEGTESPIDISGVAKATLESAFALPTVSSPVDRWAGGGVTVVVDPAFAIAELTLEESVVVAPVAGERWPMAADGVSFRGDAATVFIEHQSAGARANLAVTRREPRLDTVRVTTLELSPGAVIGRAACDIRVGSGEAFVITGRVAPEWFIDSVEAVEWPTVAPADSEDASGLPVVEPDRAIDWRVIRTASDGELRIGLAEAATPSRSLGLRITGHRRGVPIGGEFAPGDLDMVRLDGETADSAIVDYRVGPDAVIELGGEPLGLLPTDGRFAPLVEPGSPRGRLFGGARAGSGTARLVRRRPPLQADVTVQVVARDSRITESLSFTCSPEAGAVDSVVVTVSEPLGDAVEWSIVEPAGGTLYARRLEAAGRAEGDTPIAARESWLVEVRPAVQGVVTFRATRTQPFTAPVAVPLAWVDGATDARGTLVVRGAGGTRPGVVNRGLAERPPAPNDDRSAAVVTELTYGDAEDLGIGPDDPPPVVVRPPDVAEARAWVWRETTTAWCHDSGWIECESEFDIENRGRADVALTVPPGMRLDEVTIDGAPAPFDGVSEAGGTSRVLLPTGRGRVRLRVRGIASRDPAAGVWRIDPIACAIDVPLLDRTLRLKMPADLDLFMPGRTTTDDDWVDRLFDAAVVRSTPSARDADSSEAGFRVLDLPSAGSVGIYAVRRRLVSSSSILAAAAVAAVVWFTAARRPRVAATLVVALALLALWIALPFATVARAAWWGGLAGLGFGWLMPRAGRTLAIGFAAVWCTAAPAADGEPRPYRVYVTPDDAGGTALVPEPMFRRLSAAAVGRETVRVRTSKLVVTPVGPWRLELDVDAEQGGVLNIDQTGADVRCSSPTVAGDGAAIEVMPDGTAARAVVALAGLRRVVVDLVPRPERVGGLERVMVRLPAAAATRVEIVAAADGDSSGDRWHCDRGDRDGGWRPVDDAVGPFDVSRAGVVRLTRSVDARQPLVTVPDRAESLDDIWWGEDACVVNASFDVDPGRGLVRSLVVRADPPLVPVEGDAATRFVPLGDGRYLVDLPDPTAGRFRLAATFAMSLDDPTGVFDVPRVWLESVATDVRTVRCSAAAGLDLTAELPPGYALLRPRDGEVAEAATAWRSEEVVATLGRGDDPPEVVAVAAAERPRPRVAVRRRPVPPRIVQRLDVAIASDEIDLALDCQVDSRSGPFTGITLDLPADASVDRVTVVDESDGGAVDVHVSRTAPSKLRVMTQRPKPGMYRLSLAAHLIGRPPVKGVVPVVRCRAGDDAPLVVRWRTRGGLSLSVKSPTGESVDGTDLLELDADEAGPEYVVESFAQGFDDTTDLDRDPPRIAAPADVPLGNTVESTIVHLAIDEAGRIWGLARFELVAADPVVRLRFPAGFRLFDLLVDGRELQAVPAGANTWDVRLHDVRWPRSILAVFAGQAAAADAGGAIRLEPPRIDGLECRDVLWRIDAPGDMQVRVAEPAKMVGVGAWRQAEAAVRDRVADLFRVAIEGSLDADRDRLRAFADARESGGDPPLEAEWERAVQGPADARRTRAHILGSGSDGLTIRTTRQVGEDTGGRAAATAGLVAVLIGGGLAAGWRPRLWSQAIAWAWPWAILSAGVAWAVVLRPTLPGWALIALGTTVLVARWRTTGITFAPRVAAHRH